MVINALGISDFLADSLITSTSNSGQLNLSLFFKISLFRLKFITWAIIATAISSGVTAPMSRPIGEHTLANFFLSKPSLANSSIIAFTLRFEPIIPI